jgi:hypothetical protein
MLDGTDGWFHWIRRPLADGTTADHKIYVSPTVEELPAALLAVLASGAQLPIAAVKVGATPATILRPDHLIVYCDSEADLRQVGIVLSSALAGLPAQGVPFTAAVTADGLLSWGSDSAAKQRIRLAKESNHAHRPRRTQPREDALTWRTMVTAVAATGLTSGRRSGAAIEVALRHLREAGVDPATFGPTR